MAAADAAPPDVTRRVPRPVLRTDQRSNSKVMLGVQMTVGMNLPAIALGLDRQTILEKAQSIDAVHSVLPGPTP